MSKLDAVAIKNSEVPEINPVQCLQVLDLLMNPDKAYTARDIAEQTGLSLKTVMKIMAHPEFTKRFRTMKREVAKTEFDAVAYDRLMDIIRDGEDDKNRIAAAKALSNILGVSEQKKTIEHKFSFEEIIRQGESNALGDAINITPETHFPGFED